jgi:hypothetical protein
MYNWCIAGGYNYEATDYRISQVLRDIENNKVHNRTRQ